MSKLKYSEHHIQCDMQPAENDCICELLEKEQEEKLQNLKEAEATGN